MSAYIDGFLAGQAVAYCEMVTRGVRLAGQLDVPSEACAHLVELVRLEGCIAFVEKNDGGRASLWVYRDERVGRLVASIAEASFPTPSDMAIWSMGKLFGYGDREILDYLASR